MIDMKQNIFFYFVYAIVISIAVNAFNETLLLNEDYTLDDDDNENFYTVKVLLQAHIVLNSNISQNDTGFSIRLTARDGIKSEWYRLYNNEESNYFGQRCYNLPSTKHYFDIISSIAVRIDEQELTTSTVPYYICIHGTKSNNNTTMENNNWSGCAYIQPTIENKNGVYQEYKLRDANGKLI
ncbi:unnamed protein product [Rotaria socialis]|uniref:Uncharacterized protein n=2 Tax=Rotaria socialis TaxID=392032 RepID=A0A820RI73_9BILA|nr:unnamed protein product [Rotaria socialis]CAF4441872.1 unnamed protein product [Rotaria socialis]CAF4507980.1 unnamed protein product [Rotaria socialis]